MKRYILNLIAILAVFVLSACGGGGTATTSDGTAVVPSSAVSLVEAGTIIYSPLATAQTVTAQAATAQNFSLQVRYSKNLNDNYLVKVYTQSITINGCTIVPDSVVFSPTPVVMDQNTNSTAVLNITGQVDAACTNTTDYTLAGEVTIQLGDQVTKETLNVSSLNVTNPTDPTVPTDPGTGYSLTNATTPVVVNYDSEIKNISVYVIDGNGVGVADQNVSIQAISDVKFGQIISASTVQTDVSGKASFVYEAPADVKAVDGNTTSVDLLLTTNGVLETRTVEIVFNKIDEIIVKPIVVIDSQYKDINLTSNSQSITMEVRVFEEGTNAPYTSGMVKVKLPSKVLDGVDVGTFSEYSAAVTASGIATFTYTGPRDLWALVNSGDNSSTFQFYHEENSLQTESITVHYEPTGSYQPTQYILDVVSSDSNNTMGLNSQKSFVVELKDDQGTLIDSAQVTELSITTQNQQIGVLIDENTGLESTVLLYTDVDAVNPKSFHVKTNTLSGIVPIEVKITFTDVNGNVQVLEKVINVVVFSGPPTALSISYVGVEHDATIGKFIEKFVVTATDAYNNPVNTQPYISTGAMIEYAVDGSDGTGTRTTTSPRLWHGAFDTTADIVQTGTNQAQLISADPNVFQYIDINNDKVVVFGAGYVYEALGKWDILTANPGVLDLKDSYYGTDRIGLYFAVGHNNRQDLCAADGREYVGNMRSSTYQLDDRGHAMIEFEYDYHLTGKDIMVWVNLTGFQADNNTTGRIGEAQKHTLRGNGLIAVPEGGYTVSQGSTVEATFDIWHENVPEPYRNGHFGWRIKAGSTCAYSIIESTNAYDARECYANGSGETYITFRLTAPVDADCTFALEGINTATEFTSGLHYP